MHGNQQIKRTTFYGPCSVFIFKLEINSGAYFTWTMYPLDIYSLLKETAIINSADNVKESINENANFFPSFLPH